MELQRWKNELQGWASCVTRHVAFDILSFSDPILYPASSANCELSSILFGFCSPLENKRIIKNAFYQVDECIESKCPIEG